MKAETWFLIIILLVMTAVIALSSGFPYWQAKLAPLTVCGLVVILGIVQLIKELVRMRAPRREKTPNQDMAEPGERPRAYVFEAFWMGGFIIAIYLFGMLFSVPLFGIAYMRSHGATWFMSVLIAVALVVFCVGLFTYILDMRLYEGIIFNPGLR